MFVLSTRDELDAVVSCPDVETPPVDDKLRRHGPAAPPHFNLCGHIYITAGRTETDIYQN
jgi:hypothetical protein